VVILSYFKTTLLIWEPTRKCVLLLKVFFAERP
jgi:hypothetical protein